MVRERIKIVKEGDDLIADKLRENSKKRKFSCLRHLILIALRNNPLSINQISNISGINWKTVDNHIFHLVGKGYVSILHNTPYIKIFQITEKGQHYISFLKQRFEKNHIKEIDLEKIENLLEKEFSKHTEGGLQ